MGSCGFSLRGWRLAQVLVLAWVPLTVSTAVAAVPTGSEAQAKKYYLDLSKDLGFNASVGQTTLDDLIKFVGYQLTAADLESADPDRLMHPEASGPVRTVSGARFRDGDILAARFFAPKIVNISEVSPKTGWRKVVRLRTRPDSDAARASVEYVIILFNYFAEANAQPFVGKSVNTQVMLAAPVLSQRLYWMDFEPEGTLGVRLNASFDAADLPQAAKGVQAYYVPDGCNACHGKLGNQAAPMVNYLDTDHWFDRLKDDFQSMTTAVVFDAGTNDQTQPQFQRAFDIIRRFNEEALLQNLTVRKQAALAEVQAARKWLQLHAESDQHFPPESRGISLTDGGSTWQVSDADGLATLNRYCFRCHGTIKFSVFDKNSVMDRRSSIIARLRPNPVQAKSPGFKMPPDRDLPDDVFNSLKDFLLRLK